MMCYETSVIESFKEELERQRDYLWIRGMDGYTEAPLIEELVEIVYYSEDLLDKLTLTPSNCSFASKFKHLIPRYNLGLRIVKTRNRFLNLDSINWELERGSSSSIEDVLSSKYNDLPYYLKPCVLFLAVFPKQQSIERMRLIRLWIAQGFAKEEPEHKMTLEEVADEYLKALLDSKWIQAADSTSDGRVKRYRILDDHVRDFIIRWSSIFQNSALIVPDGEKHSSSSEGLRQGQRIRHLSIHNYNHKYDIPQGEALSGLHSLLVFGRVDPESQKSLSSLLLDSFTFLVVLDLRGCSFMEKIPADLSKLIHLRYLSLRDTKLKKLPTYIGKLINLETLDLKRTGITELPSEILNLRRLRHLLVYNFKIEGYMPNPKLYACKVPPGIRSLLSLQKLSFIESTLGGGILEELGKLQELRRLGITKLIRRDGVVLCNSIEKLINLKSLNIHSNDKDEIIDLEHVSSPPQFLQRFPTILVR